MTEDQGQRKRRLSRPVVKLTPRDVSVVIAGLREAQIFTGYDEELIADAVAGDVWLLPFEAQVWALQKIAVLRGKMEERDPTADYGATIEYETLLRDNLIKHGRIETHKPMKIPNGDIDEFRRELDRVLLYLSTIRVVNDDIKKETDETINEKAHTHINTTAKLGQQKLHDIIAKYF